MIIFTVQEAQSTLPLIKKIVADILDIGKEMKKSAYLASVTKKIDENKEFYTTKLLVYIKELEELGCFYKDWNFEFGLIDFPAEFDGELVYLCWRSDEPEIKYFHKIDENYAMRAEIPKKYFGDN